MINEDNLTGENLEGPIKKKQVVCLVGPSGAGKSIRRAMLASSLESAGYYIKEVADIEAKRIKGLDYDLLSMNELTHLKQLSLQEQFITEEASFFEDTIETHHTGKGDPCGLRQRFNRNGKRFR